MKRIFITSIGKLSATLITIIFVFVILTPIAEAQSEKPEVIASNVQVNRLGGITVSGTANCEAAVAAVTDFYGGTLPGELTISINIDWTAYQPVGKNKMIQASFASDFMTPCYNTYSYPNYAPCGDSGYTCPWITSHYNSTTMPAYVFSPAGKFSPGPIYVDVMSWDEGYVFIDGVPQFGITNLFGITGYNMRGVRAR